MPQLDDRAGPDALSVEGHFIDSGAAGARWSHGLCLPPRFMVSRRPNVFLIGGAKCGTTSLASYLGEHPNILCSHPKEPNYFNTDFDVRYRMHFGRYSGFPTEDSYLRMFDAARDEHRALIDGSVWYLYSEVALAQILRFTPDARFIVMLRNPVDMAYSLHGQLLWSFAEDEPSFEKAWDLQQRRRLGRHVPETCMEPSLLQYRAACALGTQLERLYSQVPPERVLVLLLDDLRAEPRACYEAALSFLQLPSDGRTTFPHLNQPKRHRSRWLGKQKYLGRLGCLGHLVYRYNVADARRAPQQPTMRRVLLAEFEHEIAKLEQLLERPLVGWRVETAERGT